MNIDYTLLSPTGNLTVLVNNPVPRAAQSAVAAKLLSPKIVGGEQAGYIERAADPRCAARLQMMGGEFCGNATMSLAALLSRDAGLADGASTNWLLEVSGSDGPVPCRVWRTGDAWIGTVRMPPPTRLSEIEIDTDGGALRVPLVEMPGIAHLLVPADAPLDELQLRRRLPAWNRAIGADALGTLIWNQADCSIDPFVYVPSAGTLVREHGCGSGTAAIGCWLSARSHREVTADVHQPGGTIRVRASCNGHGVRALSITGTVRVVREGTVSIEL